MLAGPEVEPITAIGGREPVILDANDDKEPEDDFPGEDGAVEGGNVAGCLVIVFW